MSCFVCENIRYLLEQRKINPDVLAKNTAISVERINSFINKDFLPDADECLQIADFLNIPVGRLLSDNLRRNEDVFKAFDFKFLVLDVDGVLTDGGMYYTESGDEFKRFNSKDGLAIIRLIESGKKVGFLSSGFNKNIIERRAKLLGIHYVYIGTWKKIEVLEGWCKELNISLKNVAYIGDDLNDSAIIEKVGFSACPADAVAGIKEKVDVILSKKGGNACVREFIDLYLLD